MSSVSTLTPTEGIAVQSLPAGTTLVVATRNTEYRLVIIDSERREVALLGGKLFREWTNARYSGAPLGSSLQLGWVGIGLQMEFAIGQQMIVTSPVEHIAIE